MSGGAGGPFFVGDRVFIPPFDSGGEVVKVGQTHTIRVFGSDPKDPGEIRQVTSYDVRLDSGGTRSVADRDGHLVRA